MATSTPNLGLIKPAQTEKYNVSVNNTNADLIDAAISDIQNTVDTGAVVTAGVFGAATAGWTIVTQRAVKAGNVVSLEISVTRTGATIAAGNIGNIAVTAPMGAGSPYIPALTALVATSSSGGGVNGYIGTDGAFNIAYLNDDWVTGGTVSFASTFVAAL